MLRRLSAASRAAVASAVSKWAPLVGAEIDQDTLGYFLGVASLGANTPDLALEHLGRVGSEVALRVEADWFTGLAALRVGDLDRARQALERVVAGEGRRSRAASDLLEDLE